jgi:hypothetical protein
LGHLPDPKRVQKKTVKRLVDKEPPRSYEVNTAMSGVVPAWPLLSLLDRGRRCERQIEERDRNSKSRPVRL